jgi:hypothetical protein
VRRAGRAPSAAWPSAVLAAGVPAGTKYLPSKTTFCGLAIILHAKARYNIVRAVRYCCLMLYCGSGMFILILFNS